MIAATKTLQTSGVTSASGNSPANLTAVSSDLRRTAASSLAQAKAQVTIA